MAIRVRRLLAEVEDDSPGQDITATDASTGSLFGVGQAQVAAWDFHVAPGAALDRADPVEALVHVRGEARRSVREGEGALRETRAQRRSERVRGEGLAGDVPLRDVVGRVVRERRVERGLRGGQGESFGGGTRHGVSSGEQ